MLYGEKFEEQKQVVFMLFDLIHNFCEKIEAYYMLFDLIQIENIGAYHAF